MTQTAAPSVPTPIDYPPTESALYQYMVELLRDIVPDVELKMKAEIAVEINRVKREKNAIILGHNYMEPALFHSVPDYTGDSLGLCRIAAKTSADIIVFAGVKFMAETAKILNPSRKVLIPSLKAGCSLAESITPDEIKQLKAKYPGAPVVTYVNTYAEIKAECDYSCTSGNAEKMVRHLMGKGHNRLIFLPDEYLSANTAREAGMDIVFAARGEDGAIDAPDVADHKDGDTPLMIGWRGRCEVHEKFTVEDVSNAREQFSDITVLAHPECPPDVVKASDFSGSTSMMIDHVRDLKKGRYLLLTECSMGDNIAAANKQAEMVRMCSVRCPHMNQITLEDTLAGLRAEQYEIDVDPEVGKRAELSLTRMLEIY